MPQSLVQVRLPEEESRRHRWEGEFLRRHHREEEPHHHRQEEESHRHHQVEV
jgi:hypothetical protein